MPTLASLAPQLYKDVKWLGRKAGQTFKKSKAKRRKAYHPIGEKMKISHVKRDNVFTQSDIDTDTRVLYNNEITLISAGSGEDKRDRQLINCKGIEVCFHVANKLDQPQFFNFAIIAPKHTSAGVNTIDFFRSSSGDRGSNFGTQLSALELHYLPINTDKYNILRHYRHNLGGQADRPSFYNSDSGPGNWFSKKVYIPLNRQLRYDNSFSTTCNTPIYAVWWCDVMRNPDQAVTTTNAASVSLMHTMFYTDVL